MNLITEFRDFDGNVIADFDDEGGEGAIIKGNRLEVWGEGRMIARAIMELDHNRPVWRLYKGQRGKEIGVAVDVRFAI